MGGLYFASKSSKATLALEFAEAILQLVKLSGKVQANELNYGFSAIARGTGNVFYQTSMIMKV